MYLRSGSPTVKSTAHVKCEIYMSAKNESLQILYFFHNLHYEENAKLKKD
jgi:hypothetical protein